MMITSMNTAELEDATPISRTVFSIAKWLSFPSTSDIGNVTVGSCRKETRTQSLLITLKLIEIIGLPRTGEGMLLIDIILVMWGSTLLADALVTVDERFAVEKLWIVAREDVLFSDALVIVDECVKMEVLVLNPCVLVASSSLSVLASLFVPGIMLPVFVGVTVTSGTT